MSKRFILLVASVAAFVSVAINEERFLRREQYGDLVDDLASTIDDPPTSPVKANNEAGRELLSEDLMKANYSRSAIGAVVAYAQVMESLRLSTGNAEYVGHFRDELLQRRARSNRKVEYDELSSQEFLVLYGLVGMLVIILFRCCFYEIRFGEDNAAEANDTLNLFQTILIMAALSWPTIMLMIFTSEFGFGMLFYITCDRPNLGILVTGAVVLCSAALYIFDRITKRTIACLFVSYCAGALLASQTDPGAPFAVTLYSLVSMVVVLRSTIFSRTSRQTYYFAVSALTMFIAMLLVLAWFIYFGALKQERGHQTIQRLQEESYRIYFTQKVRIGGRNRRLVFEWDCDSEQKNTVYDINYTYWQSTGQMKARNSVYTVIDKAIIKSSCNRVGQISIYVFIAPLIGAFLNFVVSMFCMLNGYHFADLSRVEHVVKEFFVAVVSSLTCFWLMAMFASQLVVISLLLDFNIGFLIAITGWIYFEIGIDSVYLGSGKVNTVKTIQLLQSSNWVRAILLLALPILSPILFADHLRQRRRIRLKLCQDSKQVFTDRINAIYTTTKEWNWVQIITKANMISHKYTMSLIGIYTVVMIFFVLVRAAIFDSTLPVTLTTLGIIGFLFFLLPMTPELPVYIVMGIAIPTCCERNSVGFHMGIFLAICLGSFVKMLACITQYCLASQFAKNPDVMASALVDQVPMRALQRIILSQEFKWPRIAFFVGASDAKPCFLCPIIDVSLWRAMASISPCCFISFLCTLSGVSQIRDREPNVILSLCEWAALPIAVFTQMGLLVFAVYQIQEISYKYFDELAAPRPEHEALVAKKMQSNNEVRAYLEVTSSEAHNTQAKQKLYFSFALCTFASYMLLGGRRFCLRPFSYASHISDPFALNGLNGNVFMILTPTGWICVLILVVGDYLSDSFIKREKNAIKEILEELERDEEDKKRRPSQTESVAQVDEFDNKLAKVLG